MFYPELLTTLKTYSTEQLARDFTAGMIVGIVALPLAIAFGIASGVTPEQGIVTAIIAGFLISALGGSRVQIGGPTGAFVIIVYEIVEKFGFEGLAVATILAGLIMIGMGLAKLGTWIRFIPLPVVIGFTSGIAVVIFSSQMRDFFGLQMTRIPSEFLGKWMAYAHSSSSFNVYACGIAILTLLISIFTPRFFPKIPGAFLALAFVTALTYFLSLPVETIQDRFGDLKMAIPAPQIPSYDWTRIEDIMPSAITIAVLGAIEALLSAVIADGMIGGKHRPNSELIAQGIANVLTPFFRGIPATGAIARTATNIRNGGQTPIAGIVHALTLLGIVGFAAPLVGLIPMASLAGILVLVAYNMSEWREFKALLSAPKADRLVLLTTFFGTVFFDLIIAIQAGIALSAFLFMKKMSEVSDIKKFQHQLHDQADPDTFYFLNAMRHVQIPENVQIFELNGAFFFGAAGKFEDVFMTFLENKKFIIFRMNQIVLLDATGLHTIARLAQAAQKHGNQLILSELTPSCKKEMQISGILNKIGEANLFDFLPAAIQATRQSA
ncbi:SulP family inorganic anion transporter [Parachlamydia sp. AcF125]|uniref:SulP family inorganic anion transporter n=1 Tax=Parachlamydia sp. AcF125 TaxID=2795736 RepID=UPI001BC9FF10|nr:SulP family inorganic anion transporter [Parachlamydia sp. AcF125]MBS4167978.1 C4-dicarboxylic acid transporter DauA [Parachlamydia sp. AcF125]